MGKHHQYLVYKTTSLNSALIAKYFKENPPPQPGHGSTLFGVVNPQFEHAETGPNLARLESWASTEGDE